MGHKLVRSLLAALSLGLTDPTFAVPPSEPTSEPADRGRATPTWLDSPWLSIDPFGQLDERPTQVNDLSVGASGDLWVATDSGISRLRDGEFKHIDSVGNDKLGGVLAIESTERGVLAIARIGLIWIDDFARDPTRPELLVRGELIPFVGRPTADSRTYLVAIRQAGSIQTQLRRYRLSDGRVRPVGGPEPELTSVRDLKSGMLNELICQKRTRQWHLCDTKTGNIGPPIPHELTPTDTLIQGDSLIVLTLTDLRIHRRDADELQSTGQDSDIRGSGSFLGSEQLGEGKGAIGPSRIPGHVWVGRRGVIGLLDLGSGEVEMTLRLPLDATPRAIAEQQNGRLWIATETRGLLMTHASTGMGWTIPSSGGHGGTQTAQNAGALGKKEANRLPEDGTQSAVSPENEGPIHVSFLRDGRLLSLWRNHAIVFGNDGKESVRLPLPGTARGFIDAEPPLISTEAGVRALVEGRLEPLDGLRWSEAEQNSIVAATAGALARLDDAGNIELHTRHPSTKSIPLEKAPKVAPILSLATVEPPATTIILNHSGELSQIIPGESVASLGVHSFPSPNEFYPNEFADAKLHTGLPSTATDSPVIYLSTPDWLWRLESEDQVVQWRPVLRIIRRDSNPAIGLAILPAEDGSGLWLAGLRVGTTDLAFLPTNSQLLQPVQGLFSSPGWSDRALVRGSDGNLLLGTQAGLYSIDPETRRAIRLEEFGTRAIHAVLPLKDGGLLVGGPSELYYRDKAGSVRKSGLEGTDYLAFFPAKHGGAHHVWRASRHANDLSLLDPDTFEVSSEFGDLVDEALEGNDGYRDLTPVGDSLYLLGESGLAVLRHARDESPLVAKVALPGWPTSDGRSIEIFAGSVFESSSGKIVVIVTGSDFGGTNVWQADSPNAPFTLIGKTSSRAEVVVEMPDGKLIIGGNQHNLFTIRNAELVRLDTAANPQELTSPIEATVALGPNRLWLSSGDRLMQLDIDGPSHRLTPFKIESGEPRSWRKGYGLGSDRAVVLGDNGEAHLLSLDVSSTEDTPLLRVERSPTGEAKVHDIGVDRMSASTPWLAFLLLDESISVWEPSASVLEAIIPLPTTAGLTPEVLETSSIATDSRGIWLSTRGLGLWRYQFESEDWIGYETLDELPSNSVEAVVASNGDSAVIVTSSGVAMARRQASETGVDWRFAVPNSTPGIRGSADKRTLIFPFKDQLVLAVATDSGLTLAAWHLNGGPTTERLWTHLSRELPTPRVNAMKWDGKRLWLALDGGIISLHLVFETWPDGHKSLRAQVQDRHLTRDQVVDISVAPGSSEDPAPELDYQLDQVWYLTSGVGYRLHRWEPDSNEVTRSEPFLLSSVLEAVLGPARAAQAPLVLTRDAQLGWNVWHPQAFHHVELKTDYIIVAHRAQLIHHSMMSTGAIRERWETAFTADLTNLSELGEKRPGKNQSVVPAYELLDFSAEPDARFVIATTSPLTQGVQASVNTAPIEYRAVKLLPTLLSPTGKALVDGGILLLTTISFTLVVFLIRRSNQRSRHRREIQELLRGEANPYKVGVPIDDADQFYGRTAMIRALRDTIGAKSCALLGPLRIGKTSIQLQLKSLLEKTEDSDHIFIPHMCDLHGFTGGDLDFFHFLGTSIRKFATDREVPEEVLAQLPEMPDDPDQRASYDNFSLLSDLDVLLTHWAKEYAPRNPILVLQIDEITQLNVLQVKTLRAFRSVFMAENNRLRTILSGPYVPHDRPDDDSSEWYNFFERRYVEPMLPDEAEQLIVDPVRDLFQYEDNAVTDILVEGRYRPFILQGFCSGLLEWKYSQDKLDRVITVGDFRRFQHTQAGRYWLELRDRGDEN